MNSSREYNISNNRYNRTDADQNSLDYGQLNESLNVLVDQKKNKKDIVYMNINESCPNFSIISIDNNPLLERTYRSS